MPPVHGRGPVAVHAAVMLGSLLLLMEGECAASWGKKNHLVVMNPVLPYNQRQFCLPLIASGRWPSRWIAVETANDDLAVIV